MPVVARFEKGRLCAPGRSLVLLVKTWDFGMTLEGCNGGRFHIDPPPECLTP